MRSKFLLAAAVGSLALLTAAVDMAQAQISVGVGRGRGWGGRDSWFVDTPYGSYGRGYYSPWYDSGWYGRGYGYGSYYGPGYGYSRFGYPSRGFSVNVGSPGFYSSPSYGYSYPASYSYPMTTFRSGPMTTFRTGSVAYGSDFQGRAEAMPEEKRALIHLMLPTPDAEVYFEGEATQSRGFQRAYISPELQPGTQYVYKIKACWMEDGQKVERTKELDVQAGRAAALAFGERAPMEETTRSAGYREGGRIDVDSSRRDRTDVERRDRIDVERRDRIDVEKRTDIDRPRTDVDVNVDVNRNRNLDREKKDLDRPQDPNQNKRPDTSPPGAEPSGKTNNNDQKNNNQTPPPE